MRPATDSSAARPRTAHGLARANFYRPAREAVTRFALPLLLPLVIMSASPAVVLAQKLSARPTDSSAATLAEFRPAATASRDVGDARQSVSSPVRRDSPVGHFHETYTRETGDIFLTPPTATTPSLPAYDSLLKFYPRRNLNALFVPTQAMSVGAASSSETLSAAGKDSYAAAPDSLLNKRVSQALRRAALEETFKKGGVTEEQYRASRRLILLAECDELVSVATEKGERGSTTVADLVVLLPDGSMLGTGVSATVVGTTPRSLLTWLSLGDSIIALQRLYDGGQISKQDFDTKLEDIGALEDQIAPLLPLNLEGVVFTIQTVTEAGLRGVSDFDVQPLPDFGTFRFINERDSAPQTVSELFRNWMETAGVLISALCALLTLAFAVWQANKRVQSCSAEPAGGERTEPHAATTIAPGEVAHSFDLSARLEASRAAARERRSAALRGCGCEQATTTSTQ